MKTLKKIFMKGVLMVVGGGLFLLSWISTGYSGEWEPVIPSPVKGTIEIIIKNLDFKNQAAGSVTDHILIIPEGMNVKWVNMDPLETPNGNLGLMPHGIQISTYGQEYAASLILTQDQNTFSQHFSEEGSYDYSCFIHSFMKGKIVVVASAE